MRNSVRQYLTTLNQRFGSGWNRFWFLPSDPRPLCLLRIGVGLVAIVWQLGWTPDLVDWFGATGLLPVETTRRVFTGGMAEADFYHPSMFQMFSTSVEHWAFHVIGTVVLLMFTLGLLTRLTSVLALIVVLSYVHRAPMITGQLEPVLTMLIAYLCLGPSGAYFSLDRRMGRNSKSAGAGAGGSVPPSWTATVSLRLIQVHLAAFYLVTGLSKLGGETWWTGDAIWWLAAQSDSRLIDLTFLRNHPFFFNAWTHGVVLFDLTFGVVIWNRTARPLLIAVSGLVWISLALVTGLVGYAVLMMVANIGFIEDESSHIANPSTSNHAI